MTDDRITFDPGLLARIRSNMTMSIDDPALPWTADDVDRYADFIAGSQSDLKTEALETITERYAKRVEYELRGAWRAGYEYVHVYEAGPELARPGLGETFRFHRDYVPSNAPPDADRYHDYKFTYDLTSVPDDVIRRAIRGELDVEDYEP